MLLLYCHLLAALRHSVFGEGRKCAAKVTSPLSYLLLPHISHRVGERSEKEHDVFA